MERNLELSVVLPSYQEAQNLRLILPKIHEALRDRAGVYEILVVDTMEPMDDTAEVCREMHARYVRRTPDDFYGSAVRTGIREAKGRFTLFMDADGSHPPGFIVEMLRFAGDSDVVAASRYIAGGGTDNPKASMLMSRLLNGVYAAVLNIPCRDISNSFKLYRTDLLKDLTLRCNHFDIIEEIIFKICRGRTKRRIREVPFTFRQRVHGETKRDLSGFIVAYLRTLLMLCIEGTAERLRPLMDLDWRRIASIPMILLAAGSVMLFLRVLSMSPGPVAHETLICSFAVAGAAAAFLFVWGDFRTEGKGRVLRIIIILTPAFLLVASYCFGMRQFGGFDHSVLIDIAWRQFEGQIPYVDFPCTLPPAFYLGAKYAFVLFGPSWKSLILFHAIWTAFNFLWLHFLLERLTGRPMTSYVASFMCVSVSMLLVAYWWYNPLTAVTASVFLISTLNILERPDAFADRVSYATAYFLLLMMKPNVAFPLLLGVPFLLATSTPHRKSVLIWTGAAFLAAWVFLLAQGIHAMDVLNSYWDIAGRGGSLSQFLQDLGYEEKIYSILFIMLIIIPLVLRNRSGRPFLGNRHDLLLVTGLIAGSIGFITNGEIKFVDMSLVWLASFLLCVDIKSMGTKETHNGTICRAGVLWWRYFLGLAVVLAFIGVGMGVTRHRVWAIGLPFQYRNDVRVETGFFRGLQTGTVFQGMLREVETVMKQNTGTSVYFGPRMQWGYAAYGLHSPKGQPVWWHPGVSFRASRGNLYVDAWERNHYELLIFFKNDYRNMSYDFRMAVFKHYTKDQSHPHLTIWKRSTEEKEGT